MNFELDPSYNINFALQRLHYRLYIKIILFFLCDKAVSSSSVTEWLV